MRKGREEREGEKLVLLEGVRGWWGGAYSRVTRLAVPNSVRSTQGGEVPSKRGALGGDSSRKKACRSMDGTTTPEGPQVGQMATQAGRGPACSAFECLAFRFALGLQKGEIRSLTGAISGA